VKNLNKLRFQYKFQAMSRLQEDAIMRGCPEHVISPNKYPKHCVDGGGVEPQATLVHHWRHFIESNSI